jgi:hypothetical protein
MFFFLIAIFCDKVNGNHSFKTKKVNVCPDNYRWKANSARWLLRQRAEAFGIYIVAAVIRRSTQESPEGTGLSFIDSMKS